MNQEILQQAREKMEKALDAFRSEAAKLRTGRASLAILDEVRVDYYGQPTALAQVATLGTPEPRLITIAPWESKIIADIEKAIMQSGLGLNPTNDGKMIRIPIPQLTEERRKELVKVIKGYAEDAKVSVRHSRRDSIDEAKEFEKAGDLTEDDVKKLNTDIQKITDEFTKKIDESLKKKEDEIMTV